MSQVRRGRCRQMMEPTTTRFKRWTDLLWPLGGALLGLLGMPLAIDQYPEFFHRNTLVLPLSLLLVVLCWVVPLFVHENSQHLYSSIRSVPKIGGILAPLLVVTCFALFGFGCIRLFRFHAKHLTEALQREQQGPTRPTEADEVSVDSLTALIDTTRNVHDANIWTLYPSGYGATVSPVALFLFFGITNPYPHDLSITSYSLALRSDECGWIYLSPIDSRGVQVLWAHDGLKTARSMA